MYAGFLFRCEKSAADLMKQEKLKKKVQLPWWNYRLTALFYFFSLWKKTSSFEPQKKKSHLLSSLCTERRMFVYLCMRVYFVGVGLSATTHGFFLFENTWAVWLPFPKPCSGKSWERRGEIVNVVWENQSGDSRYEPVKCSLQGWQPATARGQNGGAELNRGRGVWTAMVRAGEIGLWQQRLAMENKRLIRTGRLRRTLWGMGSEPRAAPGEGTWLLGEVGACGPHTHVCSCNQGRKLRKGGWGAGLGRKANQQNPRRSTWKANAGASDGELSLGSELLARQSDRCLLPDSTEHGLWARWWLGYFFFA